MRAVVILVVAPGVDQVAGMAQACNQVLVHELIPKAAIETCFDPCYNQAVIYSEHLKTSIAKERQSLCASIS